jgi:sporulation protein YlmC with PRC-barrel domain
MLTRKAVLSMTTAAAICAAPLLALGQANTGGSSQMQGTTQTTPRQGVESGMPSARGAATTGTEQTGGAPPAGGPSATGGAQGRTSNPSGAATGESLSTSGGQAGAPGAPGAAPQGNPGPNQSQLDRIRQHQGNTTGNDARTGQNTGQTGSQSNAPDGAPGNPPSTATQRAVDGVTGNRTSPDGTGNNPPGTAAGRALGGAGSAVTNAPVGDNLGSAPANRTDERPADRPGGVAGPNAMGNTGTNRPNAGAAATGATAGAMAVDSGRIQGGRRASRVIGSTVYNENNESIGEVDDIVIPAGSNQPVAIISVGGFLGIGARLVAVPYERLQMGDRDRWTLQGATRDSLQSLPAFSYDENANRRG